MDPNTARTQLQDRLNELDRSVDTLNAEDAGTNDDLSHVTQHPGDQGTEIADLERENAVIEASQNDRVEIEAALARIEDGSYGRCIDCGKEIPEGRLEIKPEVARCMDDQAKFEQR